MTSPATKTEQGGFVTDRPAPRIQDGGCCGEAPTTADDQGATAGCCGDGASDSGDACCEAPSGSCCGG